MASSNARFPLRSENRPTRELPFLSPLPGISHDRWTGVFEFTFSVDQRDDIGSVFDQRPVVQLALPEFLLGAAKRGFPRWRSRPPCFGTCAPVVPVRRAVRPPGSNSPAASASAAGSRARPPVSASSNQLRQRFAPLPTPPAPGAIRPAPPPPQSIRLAGLAEPVIWVAGILIATFHPVRGALPPINASRNAVLQ